jgi:hypothetical protein
MLCKKKSFPLSTIAQWRCVQRLHPPFLHREVDFLAGSSPAYLSQLFNILGVSFRKDQEESTM